MNTANDMMAMQPNTYHPNIAGIYVVYTSNHIFTVNVEKVYPDYLCVMI